MQDPRHPAPRGDILVVDDEQLVSWSLCRALQLEGYRVTVEYDGAAALQQLASRSFDLVITDLHLPGADGMSVAEGAGPDTPVVLISSDPQPPAWSGLHHVRAFLPKPFDLRDVTGLVRSIVVPRGG